jgi:hypothetical protein
MREMGETRLALEAQRVERASQLAQLSDAQLIAAVTPVGISHPMEMDRRLRDAVENLTAETIKSREASKALGARLNDSFTSLTREIVTFRKSSDAAAGKLAVLTWVIIGLTAALVVLTVRGGDTSPALVQPHSARSVSPSRKAATAPASHAPG